MVEDRRTRGGGGWVGVTAATVMLAVAAAGVATVGGVVVVEGEGEGAKWRNCPQIPRGGGNGGNN